jgi:hypothetical protein
MWVSLQKPLKFVRGEIGDFCHFLRKKAKISPQTISRGLSRQIGITPRKSLTKLSGERNGVLKLTNCKFFTLEADIFLQLRSRELTARLFLWGYTGVKFSAPKIWIGGPGWGEWN